MKVVILVLVLCGIAAATHPLLKRQTGCVPDFSSLGNCFSVISLTEQCNNCYGSICSSLSGSLAGTCRSVYCDQCRAAGVEVSQCCTGGDTGSDSTGDDTGSDSTGSDSTGDDTGSDSTGSDSTGDDTGSDSTGSDSTGGDTGPTESTNCTSFPDITLVSLECLALDEDTTDPVDACRRCAAEFCNAYEGADDEAACRQDIYEVCASFGVQVSECSDADEGPTEPTCESFDLTQISDECLAIEVGNITVDAAEGCRRCAAEFCNAYEGADDEAVCRRRVYDNCESSGVQVSECDDVAPTTDPTTAGALALVTVKGALAVVLLIAAFFVF